MASGSFIVCRDRAVAVDMLARLLLSTPATRHLNRNLLIYISVLLVFGLGIGLILRHGQTLVAPAPVEAKISKLLETFPATAKKVIAQQGAFSGLKSNLDEPLSRLFFQLIVIIATARIFGAAFARMGQPAVVGEMAAGIVLGPSLLGWLAPDVFGFVFPVASLGTLKLLSQIGVCLFMFAIGMELDVTHLRHQARTAVLVSQMSIAFPYFLGTVAALFLFSTLATPGTSFTAFALFMGISMSITAFPVLARILQERGMSKTPLGSTALTCAAAGDVAAWCILAFVVAIVKTDALSGSVLTIALVIVFVSVMLLVIRPRLERWIGDEALNAESPGKGVLAFVLGLVLASALATEIIGIHPLFGAFLAGVVMPAHGEFRHRLSVRIENFSSVFLLPLFFVFTGLRTQIGLLNDAGGWLTCLGIVALATFGKLGGTMLTARCTGMNWNDSFALGALMNTRGLIELIALNIGYDLGILSPRIFAMLVLMALVTTFFTGPLLTLARAMNNQRGGAFSAGGRD